MITKEKINEFRKYLKNKGLAEQTIYNYMNFINRVPKTKSGDIIEHFNEFLKSNYKDLYYSAIRQYLTFLGIDKNDFSKIYKEMNTKLEKVELERRKKLKTVSEEEIQQIIKKCYKESGGLGLMADLMYEYGLRIGAYSGGILHLMVKDISFDEGNKKITVISKGKEHILYNLNNKIDMIRDYIKSGKLSEDDRLFKYEYHYYRKRFNKITNKVVGKELGTHFFRICRATHLLARGTPLETVQLLLGHSKITTTEGYIRLSEDMRKKMFEEIEKH